MALVAASLIVRDCDLISVSQLLQRHDATTLRAPDVACIRPARVIDTGDVVVDSQDDLLPGTLGLNTIEGVEFHAVDVPLARDCAAAPRDVRRMQILEFPQGAQLDPVDQEVINFISRVCVALFTLKGNSSTV